MKILILVLTILLVFINILNVLNKSQNKKEMYTNDQDPIQVVANMIFQYFDKYINADNINSYLSKFNTIPITVKTDKLTFKMDTNVGDISVLFNNIDKNIEFLERYQTDYLLFTTDAILTLVLGYCNFTGISLLEIPLNDMKFSNVSIPFSLNIKFLLNVKDYNKSYVILNLDNTNISIPSSMKDTFNKWFDTEMNKALIPIYGLLFGPALLYVQSKFYDEVNRQFDLGNRIKDQLSGIKDKINNIIQTNKTFLTLCKQYESIIDIITQIDKNSWDFNKIVNDKGISTKKYLIITIDPSVGFWSGTYFSGNQLFIVKTDWSTAYAIDMNNPNLNNFLKDHFPPIMYNQKNRPSYFLGTVDFCEYDDSINSCSGRIKICSNHGKLDNNGDCLCDVEYTGKSCEYKKDGCGEYGLFDYKNKKCVCIYKCSGKDPSVDENRDSNNGCSCKQGFVQKLHFCPSLGKSFHTCSRS